MTESPIEWRRFHDLMPHRVREVLLVSSRYEAFVLEQDGQLTERIFIEFSELNLSAAPRVTHAATAEDAFRMLAQRRFDLVIATRRLPDLDVFVFGRRVKEMRPGKPVVLLALDELDLRQLPARLDPGAVDKVFLWTGDAKILLAIVKFIEDRDNVEHDIRCADVRAIIVVEDSVRYYSSYLGMLYTELMAQSQSLIAEGVNVLHKLMRMRARPKVLLASSYEEAKGLYERYRNNVLSIISDVRFSREGAPDPEAGFRLLEHVRADNPTLPVLIQSADEENAERARAMGAHFCNKSSPALLMEIREFLQTYLGFGDFVFRMPDGREVGRARDLVELERHLHTAPDESIEYHALRNHFSIWLMARCEFRLARKLRPQKVSDFHSIDALRAYLIEVLAEARRNAEAGVVADFSRRFDRTAGFVRLGSGSLGGKARGIAFVNSLLAARSARQRLPMPVRIPETLVLGTDAFDEFLERNALHEFAYTSEDNGEIAERFLAAEMPEKLREDLAYALERIRYPLAVRSSSLLEDSQFYPFAGVYATFMIPNNDPDPRVRLEVLCDAVKMVFASTFSRNAKAYIEATPHRIEEEKMAVIVQRLVGRRHENRFYPHFAGVAQSYNFYPVGHQKPEDGIALVALGLGRMVVEGGEALRFSPRHPGVLPQFATPQAVLRNAQRTFFALDLSRRRPDLRKGQDATLGRYDLADAERDGTLHAVGSVYEPTDNVIRDSLDVPGPRVVTFNNVLRWGTVPLAPTLDELLAIAREGMGCPVELEFAVDLGEGAGAGAGEDAAIHFLQVRPLLSRAEQHLNAAASGAPGDLLCHSTHSMGFGRIANLHDLVYVRPDRFDRARTARIAVEVGTLNERLVAERRPFILVGPGRWGSAEHWLGIPVQWSQISGARVIVEAYDPGLNVEPSQGTHFFQNITSLRIGYITVVGGADGDRLDWEWLAAQPAFGETEHLRHLRFPEPLLVHLDGQSGRGLIAKPGAAGAPR